VAAHVRDRASPLTSRRKRGLCQGVPLHVYVRNGDSRDIRGGVWFSAIQSNHEAEYKRSRRHARRSWCYTALSLFPEKPNDHGVTIDLFLLTLIAIPLYAGLSRLLMNKAGLIPSRGEFIGKGIVLLVSVMIWLVIPGVVREFAPDGEVYGRPIKNPWLRIESFGSILIAWLSYKIAMRIIERDCDEQNDPPGGESAATRF
jgi:hypothetical protein